MTAPVTGDTNQLAAMRPILCHCTLSMPAATIPNPITAPMMEWVVDTGWPR